MRRTTILLVALGLLFAGCGGSSGGRGSSSGAEAGTDRSGSVSVPVSKKVYVKRADAICKAVPEHYVERLQKLETELAKKPDKSEEFQKAVAPPLRTALGELEELSPPQGGAQEAKAIVEALEAGIEGLEQKPNSKLKGPKSPLAEFTRLTKAYGAEYCGSL